MSSVTWVIKASKFCNLRCSYCYEWNSLSDKERIPLDLWEKIFKAARSYHSKKENDEKNIKTTTYFTWHGGEPLLLPIDYIEDVIELQKKILGEPYSEPYFYVNSFQTNLYQLKNKHIKLIKDYKINIGVSFDVVSGVRLTESGRSTEEKVFSNMAKLRASNIDFGVISVIAGHNKDHITEIYDLLASIEVPFRVLPLFDGPQERPTSIYETNDLSVLRSLEKLVEHHLSSDVKTPVYPLDGYLKVAIMNLLGIETRENYDRRLNGEGVIIINTDGGLFQERSNYDPKQMLGSLSVQTIDDILKSPEYEKSLIFDKRLEEKYCGECEFNKQCNKYPLFSGVLSEEHEGEKCPFAYPLISYIKAHLIQYGFDEKQLRAILLETMSSSYSVLPRTEQDESFLVLS